MSNRFAWDDKYSVNNELIDRQHRRLLDLADKLLQSADEHSELLSNLEKLCAHTKEHFRTEEKLMREYSFPGYVEHRATHDRIMDQLYDLRSRLRVNPGACVQLESLMIEWVLEHIESKDKLLANFLG
jgi:hemerythrin